MGDGGGAVFVDQMTRVKPVDGKRRVQRMRLIVGNGVRIRPTGTRCCLEATRTPSAVEIEAFDIRLADDRACIRRYIHNPAPLPVHPHAREHREHFDDRLESPFNDVKAAALTEARVLIDARTDHQIALVGLADIGVHRVRQSPPY